MKLIYIVLTSVALVSAETPRILDGLLTENFKTINIRDIVERYIPVISHFVLKSHLDPYALQPSLREFWWPFPNVPLISYKAHLKLYSGELKSLSNLQFDDATLTYENKVIKVTIDTAFPLLKVASNYDLKLRFINPKGTITADAKAVHANAIITFNTMDYTLALNDFQLQPLNIKNVLIQDQSGWKFVVLSAIADIVAALNKDKITKDIQADVEKAIREQLDEINRNVPPEKLGKFFQDILLELKLDN